MVGAILEVRDLCKAYGSSVAVHEANLDIPKGMCYGLLGPNGAGKSTLISMITGTINADRGHAQLEGRRIATANLDVKQRIGYVPQDLALYEDLSALENLRFFGMIYGLQGSDLSSAIDRCLTIAALADRSKEPVRTFSGGMKRRLNIAAALLHDPVFLVLDEPTVGVDPQSRNLIFDALEALVASGKTVLYTTHYMEEVERLCKRVAIMDHGRVIAEGEVSELHRLIPAQCIVEIELAAALSQPLGELPGVLNIRTERATLTLELEELTRDLPSALESIGRLGGIVENVRTQKPSLEQVFLHLTGRVLRD